MHAASLRAQAKINLRLRILARESTGYHQIETLFCRLALADDVRVELTGGSLSLSCDGPAMPESGLGPLEENLAVRAATAYLAACGNRGGVRIDITKNIPVGGGLGGGSADAGAVLRILQHLLGGLSENALMDLAASLGADVPFLTQDRSTIAWGWGRGDRLLPLPSLPAVRCTLVVAPFGVNTRDAYSWLGFEAPTPRAALMATAAPTSWKEVPDMAANDFERVVLPRHDSLRSAFEALVYAMGAGALVRMSGSGATLFALELGPGDDARPAPQLPPGFRFLKTTTATHIDRVTASE